MFLGRPIQRIPDPSDALPGRPFSIDVQQPHFLSGRPLEGPYPDGTEKAHFGMGCFWGAERVFWSIDGVWVTAVGYTAGFTPNPTYQEVCSGLTGHSEVVLVVFDPAIVSFQQLVQVFFENHDPTHGMRQGNDIGTQYRSGIYFHDEAQRRSAESLRDLYQAEFDAIGYRRIRTEIEPAGPFWFAESYHQQYLAKDPGGYCGISGTGIACPSPPV